MAVTRWTLANAAFLTIVAAAAPVSAQRVEVRHHGTPGDRLGFAVTTLPLPGGGGDLVVGLPFDGEGARRAAGAVSRRTILTAEVVWTTRELERGGNFGWAVVSGPDLDGDGVAEVLCGAPGRGNGAGGVVVLDGATGVVRSTLVDSAGSSSLLGTSLAVVGDLDGDGVDDVAAGAPGVFGPGQVLVFSTASGEAILRLLGRSGGERFGAALCATGDLDGDRIPDLLVGAPDRGQGAGRAFAGAVTLFSGATGETLLELDGAVAERRLGESLDLLGDVNGDGKADFLVGGWGAPGASGGRAGAAFVVSGGDGTLIRRIDGLGAGDRFGEAVCRTPDLDGDGLPDLAVGAGSADGEEREDTGRVTFFSSATGGELGRLLGTSPGEGLGSRLALLPDLNSGGKQEILVASPYYFSGSGAVSGAVTVVSFDEAPPPPVACSLSVSGGLTACPGHSAEAFLRVEAVEGSVTSLSITLLYDPSVCAISSVELLPLAAGWESAHEIDNGTGRLELVAGGEASLEGAGELARLVLLAVGEPEATSELVLAGTANAEAVPCSVSPGAFSILDCGEPGESTVAGAIHYYRAGTVEPGDQPVVDVLVGLSGDAVGQSSSGEEGSYGFEGLSAGSYVLRPHKTGDRRDGITALDTSIVARASVGLLELTEMQRLAADVSGDGMVTSLDASLLARYVVGILAELPVAAATGSGWAFRPSERTVEVDGDVTGQDFVALLYGDVTGNWGGRGAGFTSGGEASELSPAKLLLAEAEGVDGRPLLVRLSLPRGVVADVLEARIAAPGYRLVEARVTGEEASPAEVVASQDAAGLVTVVVFSPHRLTADTPLVELVLAREAEAGVGSARVRLVEASLGVLPALD